MTTNITTTPEQSARLLQCGVDPETADMSWRTIPCPSDNVPWSDPQLLVLPYSVAKDIYHDDYIESAWSLSALLSLLPKEIDVNGTSARLQMYNHPAEYWIASYVTYNGGTLTYQNPCSAEKELIDALCSLLVWCLEKGYVKP